MRPGLNHQYVTHVHHDLDLPAMAEAASYLEGVQDFNALRSKHCQAPNPVREMHFVRLYKKGEFLILDVQANAFLHHMVRNIAGSLLTVGRGDQSPQWLQQVLQGRDRSKAGITAPASGLHLVGVGYEPGIELPSSLEFPAVSVGIVSPENRVFPR